MIRVKESTTKPETSNEIENPKAKYSLEELLEGVNENNLHGEVEFGEPVGKEIIDSIEFKN